MENTRYRTYASVDCSALRKNYKIIRDRVGTGCKIMSVIKADGYGHGAVKTAKALCDSDYFGVACIDEAVELREHGIETPILILGYTSPDQAEVLIKNNLSQCVFSSTYAKELQNNLPDGSTLTVHLKVDTGMSRLGFYVRDNTTAESVAEEIASLISETPSLNYEGIFTHFVASESPEQGSAETQFRLFLQVTKALEEKGISFRLKHCANSAATLLSPEYRLDMVRPGIALYGYSPDPKRDFGLTPALSLKATVAQVRKLAPGDTVSYNGIFRADTPMETATVCIGYGDGLHRILSDGAPVLVHGKKTRILGRICMDQCIIDVTGIPVRPGDPVTLIGTDGNETVTAEDLAAYANTISYEILCSLGKRIPRIYPEKEG